MPLHPPVPPLSGAPNFRDLGGLTTADGRQVRPRRVFRSDHLAALTADDLNALRNLGVTLSVDFRGQAERAAQTYDWPGLSQLPLSIEPTVVQRLTALLQSGQTVTPDDTVRLMQQTYLGFVHDQPHRFATLFQRLLTHDEPLVFHCTAGKDRTGWAAALILLALGVPRSTVMQDYLVTNQRLHPPQHTATPVPQEVLEVLWRVQPAFLQAALDAVDQGWGGHDAYLQQALGLGAPEREHLRQRLLRPG